MQDGQPSPTDWTSRRRFLKALGALGVTGLAGCGGDDGETPIDTTEPVSTTAPAETTARGETTGPPTTEPELTTDPEETTVPPTTEPVEGTIPRVDPAPLLSFGNTPTVEAGRSTTITGTVTNPYLFDLIEGEITIEPPGDDWEISPVNGTTIDGLGSQSSQSAEWEVSAPESAGGEVPLNVSVSYASSTDDAETSFERPLVVVTPVGQAPMGIDCGGCHFDDPVIIDGLTFRPTPATRRSVQFESGSVKPVPEGKRWWAEAGVAVDPAPNSSTNDTDEIEETEHDQLHLGEWWADGQFAVTIGIENGTYDVTLHTAEVTNAGEDGARVYSATVNGETVFDDLDINAEVGGSTALTRTVEGLEVTDGEITVDLEASVNNPKLSAIEIREP